MNTPLKTLAVESALISNWKDAISYNEQILAENPSDLDCLNRLGFAFMKAGKYRKAKEIFNKIIEIDETNPIALKNIKRLETVSKIKNNGDNSPSQNSTHFSLSSIFIEEAGKTKAVQLKNISDKKTLSMLEPGDEVMLVIKRSKIFVQTLKKIYIGMLPDNISMRLISFMKGGNEYVACVKACDDKNVMIFVKETKKAAKFKNQASFPSSATVATD